jgi:hypothetical protein
VSARAGSWLGFGRSHQTLCGLDGSGTWTCTSEPLDDSLHQSTHILLIVHDMGHGLNAFIRRWRLEHGLQVYV